MGRRTKEKDPYLARNQPKNGRDAFQQRPSAIV
jgi:hypothetical protein